VTHFLSRLVHVMNPLNVKGLISKPADYNDNRSVASSAEESDEPAPYGDDDLGDDMEFETRTSADHFEECLKRAGFKKKHVASGLLFAERMHGSKSMKNYLHATTLKDVKPQRSVRPEFMKQVLRQGTWDQLEEKLKLTPAGVDRGIFPFGRIEIQDCVEDCFKSKKELNSDENGFSGSVIALLKSICCFTQVPSGYRLNTHQKTNQEFIAWGLLPKKAPAGMPTGQLLDTESGCMGRCDYVLKRGLDNKPFAVFEFKKLSSPDYNKLWYRQARPWVLQVFNSFVGSNAEVGGALAPDCFFLLWRVEASRTRRLPTTGTVTMSVEGDLTYSTYDYYALDTTHLQPITDDNVDKLADFFVELARICGSLEKVDRKRSVSEVISETEPSPFVSSTTIVEPPSKRTPKSEEMSKTGDGVTRSWITQIGKDEDLPVAAVNPRHFFDEVELKSIFETEDEFEMEMEELGILPDY
jgi:hypothetical protein